MAENQIKVDLHTHSSSSPDGAIRREQYFQALDTGTLQALAITDHNRIDLAARLAAERPKQIIVGEEIMTREGEVIGLFLSQQVPPGLSALETMQLIRSQNGLVYIPHPLERMRKGLSMEILDKSLSYIDAIEYFNGRALRRPSHNLRKWAEKHNIPLLAASDAHAAVDLGRTYTIFESVPSADTFHRLAASCQTFYRQATIRGRLAPSINRLRRH